MQATININEAATPVVTTPSYTPLHAQVRDTVSTEEAAFHLHRAAQTLRRWACYEDGPLRPVRVNSRLAWRVADIIRVLETGSAS